MFEFEVVDFKGCRRASIGVSGIALLVGDGGACKTSILQAITAVTTGEMIPVKAVKKSEALRLVRSGAEKGRVVWSGEGFKQTVAYPKAEMALEKGSSAPPAVSVYAAGLQSLLDLAPKDRAAVLYPLMKAEPTPGELLLELRDRPATEIAALLSDDERAKEPSEAETAKMQEMKLDPDNAADRNVYWLLTKVWRTIKDKGWNTAHAEYAEKATDAKRDWKKITRANWGAVAGETWKPAEFDDSLLGANLADLTAKTESARAAVDAANRAEGASDAVRALLKAKVDKIPALESTASAAKTESDKQEQAWREFSIRTTPLVPSEPIPCPHCNGALSITSDLTGARVEKAEGVSPEAIADAKAKRAQYDADRLIQEKKTNEAIKAAREADAALQDAKKAEADLNRMDATTASAVSVEDAKEAETKALSRLDAFKAYHDAASLHQTVIAAAAVALILSEDKGIRRTKLSQALEAFNKAVLLPLLEPANKEAAQSAIWKPVTINEDFEIEYAGRGLPMLCKSEQNRCRIVMQLALAKLDGSALLVIDDMDTIPVKARPGLLKMLKATGINAVVAVMIPDPDKAPNLAQAGFGETYWIENGESMSLADARARAAA